MSFFFFRVAVVVGSRVPVESDEHVRTAVHAMRCVTGMHVFL